MPIKLSKYLSTSVLLSVMIVLILLFSGCSTEQPQGVITSNETNFSFPEKYSSEYLKIEGTGFNMPKHVVVDNQVYSGLTYKNTSDLYEIISFSNIETLKGLNLSEYLIKTLPNRSLQPEKDEDYLASLKSQGWQHITTNEREIWVQGLFTNLEGYESVGWMLNNKTSEILAVSWTLVDSQNHKKIDENYALSQYKKFLDIIQKVKF